MNVKLAKQAGSLMRKVGDFAHVNSPAIFAGLAITGVVATVGMTARATTKACNILNEATTPDPDTGEMVKPSFKDQFIMTWPCYIPPVLMASVTIGCIVMGHNASAKRNAALAGLYSVSQEALKEYEQKVEETVGKGKAEKVRDAVIDEEMKRKPFDRSTAMITGRGDTLCFDRWSGRYFFSDINAVRTALNDFNESLIYDECKPLNDLYELMGIDPVGCGEEVGWAIGQKPSSAFVSKLSSDGTPCLVIDFSPRASATFRDF